VNEKWVSPASHWEIAIKVALGKYELAEPFKESFAAAMGSAITQNGFLVLPIELRHTEALIHLPRLHKDPFDRLIIAQAMAEGIDVISADKELDGYPITRRW